MLAVFMGEYLRPIIFYTLHIFYILSFTHWFYIFELFLVTEWLYIITNQLFKPVTKFWICSNVHFELHFILRLLLPSENVPSSSLRTFNSYSEPIPSLYLSSIHINIIFACCSYK